VRILPVDESIMIQIIKRKVPRRKSISLIVGIAILAIVTTIAICAPLLSDHDPTAVTANQQNLSPTSRHLLGTDFAGRDRFSRLLYSIRLAYWGALIAVTITVVVATPVGLLAGYNGGWTDVIAMRIAEMWLAMPGLLFLLVFVAIFGKGLYQVLIAIGIGGIPGYAKLVRSITLNEKKKLYVTSARTIGASTPRILFRHILPNITTSLITYLAVTFGGAILASSSLSLLGFGSDPSVPELGSMLNEGRERFNHSIVPIVGPTTILWLTLMGTNLISDGITER